MAQWLLIPAVLFLSACDPINQFDQFIETRVLRRTLVSEARPAPLSQCCLCQKKTDFDSSFENLLLPSYTGDNCAAKMTVGAYKNCEKVTLTAGTCSLMEVKRTPNGYKCEPVARHFMKDGQMVAINPPDEKSGPCNELVQSALRSSYASVSH